MSRYYGMHVEITDYTPDKSAVIQNAANKEWNAFADNWDEQNAALSAYGEESLCGGESEDDFAARLTHAIWTANGTFCDVTVSSTYLENLPSDMHTLSREDYDSFIADAAAAVTPPSSC